MILSIVQTFLFFDILALSDFFLNFSGILPNKGEAVFAVAIPIIAFELIYNNVRYGRLYEKDGFRGFSQAWENEGRGVKTFKGWVIGLFPLLSLGGVPLLLHYLTNLRG